MSLLATGTERKMEKNVAYQKEKSSRLPVRKKHYILIEELSPERNRLI